MKERDTYKEAITLNLTGATVRVFVPELSQAETKRRMKVIHDAAADLLRERIRD